MGIDGPGDGSAGAPSPPTAPREGAGRKVGLGEGVSDSTGPARVGVGCAHSRSSTGIYSERVNERMSQWQPTQLRKSLVGWVRVGDNKEGKHS